MGNDNLALVEHVNGTALEAYQDRTQVRELADRLLSLHPASREIGQAGMFAVAQLALLVGASPLPGTNEIHVWRNKDKVQFQLGINYYRRKRDEQGGILWSIKPRQMREDEREQYGVPKGMHAAICEAVRRNDMDKYHEMGFKANQVWDMCGAVGIGTCRDDEGKVGRTPLWTAFKRCEVDLYRQLFPTLMQTVAQAQQETIKISDGTEWQEFSSEEVNDMFSYGDAPEDQTTYELDIETGEYVEADDMNQDAETAEGTEMTKAEQAHHDPDFWQSQAEKARDADTLIQALYQLHLPSGVFKDATATKKAVTGLCGKDAENAAVIATINTYVQIIADGGKVDDARAAAQKRFSGLNNPKGKPEQEPLFNMPSQNNYDED